MHQAGGEQSGAAASALQLKQAGSRAFEDGRYPEACTLFGEAISVCPRGGEHADLHLLSVLYCNRSLANMELSFFSEALADARAAAVHVRGGGGSVCMCVGGATRVHDEGRGEGGAAHVHGGVCR